MKPNKLCLMLVILCLFYPRVRLSSTTRIETQERRLIDAIEDKDVAKVKALLDQGISPNASDEYAPAIVYAVEMGDVGIVRLLIGKKADVNAKNANGYTPLIMASLRGKPLMCRVLLEHGADPNLADSDGHTPLMFSVFDVQIYHTLLKYGAKSDICSPKGTTLLMEAARTDHISILKSVLASDKSINKLNFFGESALSYAIRTGNVENTLLLIKHGANAKLLPDKGASLVVEGAMIGDVIMLRTLLKAYPHLLQKDVLNPALFRAVELGVLGGHVVPSKKYPHTIYSLLKLLSQFGGNWNARNLVGDTLLMHACREIKWGYNDRFYMQPLQEMVRHIDINTKNNKGETALMLAAERGEYELVRWLLSNGSQIHLIDRQGGTAFTYALKNIMLPNSKFKFALLDERIRLQQSYFQIAGYLLFLSALQ